MEFTLEDIILIAEYVRVGSQSTNTRTKDLVFEFLISSPKWDDDIVKYEFLPQHIKDIVDSWDDNKELYSECIRIQKELNHIGWDCDYGLSGEITDVWEIQK